MDLHRRRSVLVRMTEAGEALETVRITNDPEVLREVMARAGECPEVVLEATYGWYWAADTLAELGASVHLAHPLGVKAFSYRRVKNDERDAAVPGRSAADGPATRGLDRPTADAGSYASWCATARNWSACVRTSSARSTPCSPAPVCR